MSEEVIVGGRYRHFKGKDYEVICVGRDTEDPKREFVVYRALYDSPEFGEGQIWVRELSDFCGFKEKDGKRIKRFELVEEGMVRVKVKKLVEGARVPTYAHEGDAGMDLYSVEELVIPAVERRVVKTGISMEIPEGYVALFWDKSGLAAKKGITVMGGVIDSHYRGEFMIILFNSSKEDFEIREGDKIAQVLIQKVERAEIEEVEELGETLRGEGRFGSTGGSNID